MTSDATSPSIDPSDATLSAAWRGAFNLFAASELPLILLDADGAIVAALNLTELPDERPDRSRRLVDVIPDEQHREALSAAIGEVLQTRRPHQLDVPTMRGGSVHWYQACLSPLADEVRRQLVLVLMFEVTARKGEEDRLLRSERMMVDAQGKAHLGTWEWDPRDPHADWSDELYRIYGLDKVAHVPSYTDYLKRVHPDDRQRVMEATDGVFKDFRPYSHDERVYRPDGSLRYLHTWAEAVVDPNGHLLKLIGVCQDITDLKTVEHQLRASLKEKDVLLGEVHHRVKNNLQVIASLLNLQASNMKDGAARHALAESRNRVQSMALVHETLYQSGDLSRVNLGEYLDRLVQGVYTAYSPDPQRISLELHLPKDEGRVLVDVDVAVNVGLAVNELASNALKHAFPGDRHGALIVRLNPGDGAVDLFVGDDGIGLPEYITSDHTETLGFRLVSAICDQLGATLDVERRHGTTFHLHVPTTRMKSGKRSAAADRSAAHAETLTGRGDPRSSG